VARQARRVRPVGNDHVAQLQDVNGRNSSCWACCHRRARAAQAAPLLDVMRPTLEQLVQQMMKTKVGP
jgi:hypothetical protein